MRDFGGEITQGNNIAAKMPVNGRKEKQ